MQNEKPAMGGVWIFFGTPHSTMQGAKILAYRKILVQRTFWGVIFRNAYYGRESGLGLKVKTI